MAEPFPGVLKHTSKTPGFFASVTFAGVAEESPDALFHRFLHPLGNAEVFSGVTKVEELGRQERRGSRGERLTEVDVLQTVQTRVFGKTFSAPMHMRMTCDHAARQVQFEMVKGNGFMRRVEGYYKVLSLDDCCSQEDLLAMAAALSAPASCATAAGKGSSAHSSPGKGRAWRQGQPQGSAGHESGRQGGGRSVVIMHQRFRPRVTPPPPFGSMLKGFLVDQAEGMMHELLAASRAAAALPAGGPLALGALALPSAQQALGRARCAAHALWGSMAGACDSGRREWGALLERGALVLLAGGVATAAIVGVRSAVAPCKGTP